MGIPESPWVDLRALKAALIEKQRQVHPDTGAYSEDSQDVNASYEALRKPGGSVRCFILLHVAEQELNLNRLPPDFLMEMMEISDAINDFKHGEIEKEIADTMLRSFENNLEMERSNYLKINQPILPEQLINLIVWFQKFQYLKRLRKNLEGIEEL